jgi:hypothetical protein
LCSNPVCLNDKFIMAFVLVNLATRTEERNYYLKGKAR